MKSEFRHDNFEEFLSRSADNLRMKAPDKVWQNISSELSKRNRRFGSGLRSSILFTALLGYLTINTTYQPLRLTENPAPESTPSTLPSLSTVTPNSKGQSSAEINTRTTGLTIAVNNKQAVSTDISNVTEPVPETIIPEQEVVSVSQIDFKPTVAGSYFGEEKRTSNSLLQGAKPAFLATTNGAPWTIESVTNLYAAGRSKKSRFQTQFYFTPTISYRKLTENKSYLRTTSQSASNYAALYNVNNMVTHKPDMGFELGVTEKYAVSKTVRIRAGLQLNVNRYDIKAFNAPYAVATIALNNRRSARVDSLRTMTNVSNIDVARNNNGSWLQNFSFQASAPVGVEIALKGNEKMQFGIAGSVQPTYILGDRSYMITNDYKSYTQVPWLLRRWNVNAAFETFVQYHTGKTMWQVGPQVRYQLLSSFISNYPVKENLFDFGLKIGVSINR